MEIVEMDGSEQLAVRVDVKGILRMSVEGKMRDARNLARRLGVEARGVSLFSVHTRFMGWDEVDAYYNDPVVGICTRDKRFYESGRW